ncbi:hypothetical protein SASC598J21_001100, partial [Snodgrassella alvi SCGC AB-598-J21]
AGVIIFYIVTLNHGFKLITHIYMSTNRKSSFIRLMK